MTGSNPRTLYIELLKLFLTRYGFEGHSATVKLPSRSYAWYLWELLRGELREKDVRLVESAQFDAVRRQEGRDWPADAETMVGLRRLENIQYCVEAALAEGIPGDLIETGTWRGGAAIFMRGLLAAHGVGDRTVWVADSFQGLPRPDPERFPEDAGDQHWTRDELAVSLSEVQDNFRRYRLLDAQVRFLEGWFEDTLPKVPIQQLAVLRLDGDMYGSTMTALEALYDRMAPGGFVIVDDYGAIRSCRKAIDDFRESRGINEPIEEIDWTGVWWRVPV